MMLYIKIICKYNEDQTSRSTLIKLDSTGEGYVQNRRQNSKTISFHEEATH